MEWNVDPVMIRIVIENLVNLEIRYYGVLFAFGIFVAYLLWKSQMALRGYSEELAESFVLWGFIAVLLGARLGHCLFYEPEFYLSNPIEILRVWRGGLASHGAGIALVIALFCFHRIKKVPLIEVIDCISLPATVPTTTIRMGNFMNSEIVGRATDVPWAVKFPRYTQHLENITGKNLIPQLRHPSQLYEVVLGLVIFITLLIVNRKYGKDRPVGLMVGLFLSLYFTGRFLVEYFKEYQALSSNFPFTMGQLLSVPFALLGYALLIRVYLRVSRTKANQV